jgi:ABC-type multidrug transport system fused ATPase/permease subunit
VRGEAWSRVRRLLETLRKSFDLVPAGVRWHWIALIPLALAAAGMETAGAAVVFLLMQVLDNPEEAAQRVPPVVHSVLGPPGGGEMAGSLMLLVALLFLFKNAFLGAVAYWRARTVSRSIAMLSQGLLSGYLAAPYALHLRRNSAELIRNATDSAEAVFSLVTGSAVNLATELLVVAGILCVLALNSPGATLGAVALMLAVMAILLRMTRGAVARWGSREQAIKKTTLQGLHQSLGGLKEVKVLGREAYFRDSFAAIQMTLARIRYRRITLSAMPQLLIESLFVGAILVVVMLLFHAGEFGAKAVPLAGLYAYAGFRIIPSVHRILLNLNNVRFGSAAVDAVYGDHLTFRPSPSARVQEREAGPLPFRCDIVLEGLGYRHEGAPTAALEEVHLRIPRGESLGIVGSTGAGKSTLVDVLTGLLQPSVGRVLVDGRDIQGALRAWQRNIGYVPQRVYLVDDTLRRNIAFGIAEQDIDETRLSAAVRMAQLDDVVDGLPLGLDTVVGENGTRLSGGQRQRVAIARALYADPEVLILDEATSALDSRTEQELARAIHALRGRKTLIIVAHRTSTVRQCDRLVFLHRGRVAAVGSFAELTQGNADFRRVTLAGELEGVES